MKQAADNCVQPTSIILWSRLATWRRLLIGLLLVFKQNFRPIRNRRQVANLPYILSVFLCAGLSAQSLDDCRTLRHHGKLSDATACFTRLTNGPNPYLRAEGLWGIEKYKDAN